MQCIGSPKANMKFHRRTRMFWFPRRKTTTTGKVAGGGGRPPAAATALPPLIHHAHTPPPHSVILGNRRGCGHRGRARGGLGAEADTSLPPKELI
jgi:hypothetical protein